MSAPQEPVLTKDALQPHVAAGRVVVGPHTYGAPVLRYWGSPGGYVCRIGDYCSIADNVQVFLGGYHRPDWVTTYNFSVFQKWEAGHIRNRTVGRGDVVIGSDVWLCSQCVILAGVTIGHGAVVGAKAVVTHDVPPYAVVAGNPARIVKYRFDDLTIAELLAIAWWDWPQGRIKANVELMMSGDIQAFIERNRAGPEAS
jgi:acetyltransferase-like isoleucine patch superfamily enzyme